MSDHCAGCRYKVKEKDGPDACPFNYLYWDFIMRNAERLRQSAHGHDLPFVRTNDDERRAAIKK
jgi:deoxyribodipyrimidine photolyase-related protein